jgi:hypothetical protein
MNPILESASNTFGSIFILVAAYGAIKRIRDLFLFGICFFGAGLIIKEGIDYAQDNNIVHLFVIMVFLGQVILTLPINTSFDEKNKAAIALSNRIGCAILVINLFQGYLILSKSLDLPHQFGFMHLVIALIMLYTVLRSGKEKI